MAIIPLVVDGDNPTVVEARDGFDMNGDAIRIGDMCRESLTDESSNVSYDLRVGREYKDHRDKGKHDLPKGGKIILHPGTAVIVETEEYIQLPRTLFALVVPKVTLLQKGLSNTMSKVDPGYHGHLLVTLFNLGQQTETISRGDSCCALCVMQVHGEPSAYAKGEQRIQGYARRRWWRSVRDFLQRNSAVFTVALMLITAISVLINAWVLLILFFR